MPKRKTKKEFIRDGELIHGDKYDYSKVNYINAYTKVIIICKKHGEFEIQPQSHTNSHQGCYWCGRERVTSTVDVFIKKAIFIHGNRYSYDNAIYINSYTPICITCHIHGDFYQTPYSHLQKKGCPKCSISRGEVAIINFLDKYQIVYEKEKRLLHIKEIRRLRFDFFIAQKNLLIEYNGLYHYEPIENKGGLKRFEEQKEADKRKEYYARKNGYNFLIIPYWEYENIKKILSGVMLTS